MSGVCRECRDGLEHCHGTVVHHSRFGIECTDDCATPDVPHAFSVDCEAVGCACAQPIGSAPWSTSSAG
ncbi:MAG: hypothetical protein ABW137_33105 [Mycobacterium sp.]